MKRCAHCHRIVSRDRFTPNKKMLDGRDSYCRDCRNFQAGYGPLPRHVEERTCRSCGRPLAHYNPGPLCFCCDTGTTTAVEEVVSLAGDSED